MIRKMKKSPGISESEQLQNELEHRMTLLEKLIDFKKETSVKKSDSKKEPSTPNNQSNNESDGECKNYILSFIRRAFRKLIKMFCCR